MSKPFEDWPLLMSRKAVGECLGLSTPRVSKLFKLPDFPLLDDSKREQVIVNTVLVDYIQRRAAK